MLIIIEGCDRAGKTTLAKNIAHATKCRYVHFSAPRLHPLDEYVEPFLHYKHGAGVDMVFDRGYLGELVWPKVFERSSKMTAEVLKVTEGFFVSRRALLVLAVRPIEDLVRDSARDGEPVNAAQVRQADELFGQAFAASPISKVIVTDAISPFAAERVARLARTVEEEVRA